MNAALPWSCRVVAMADAYEADGMRRDRAFRRALEACRDPNAVLVPDAPARFSRPALGLVDWLATQDGPRTALAVAQACRVSWQWVRATLIQLEDGGLVHQAGEYRASKGHVVALWAAGEGP